ncbi:radical SAM protein [Candidatus Woesearchaeota archaeon]|nr:radical SAM protein [Candidatus Woesearchaeota archaeon]
MLEHQLRLKAPLIAQFEITPACNNNCGFCYNFWQYNTEAALSRKSHVNEKKIKELMNILIEYEVPAICFTGGEPFLAKKTLFEIVGEANQHGIYTSINTNGRLINRETAMRLREAGLNSLLVSLHGDSNEVHEEAVGCKLAFSETLAGIENLVDLGLNTTVNYVATQRNIERVIPTAKMLKNMGVKKMTVTPLLPFPGVKDHKNWAMKKEQFKKYFSALIFAKEIGLRIDSTLPVAPCILKDMFPKDYLKYLEVLSPRVCMAGVTFMVVSPQGFNRACIQAPQLTEYGRDISKSFVQAWNKSYEWSKLKLLPKECSNECYALASCGGGCRTSSLAENNSTSGKTMYMGEPIANKEAEIFLKRTEVCVDREVKTFRKRKEVKLREEKFGGVLANTANQSFVILDKEGVNSYQSLPNKFCVDKNNRGIYVLYAAGIITPIQENNLHKHKKEVSVIHASKIYQRLAGRFQLDDKIRLLRADTGERIYF